MILTLIIAFASLIALMVIHEFGHFIIAKKFGVRVDEFGIGYPPRIFGKKIGETIYSINLIPLGAFVRIYGEEGGVDDYRSFMSLKIWKRVLIILGGVAAFWLASIILFSVVFALGADIPVGDQTLDGSANAKIKIVSVAADSPAFSAGLKTGDTILNIDKISDFQKFSSDNKGKEISLTIERQGKTFDVSLTPRISFPENQGPVGVSLERIASLIKKYPWYQAPFLGTKEALYISWMIVSGIAMILYQLVFFGVSPQGVAGPVGIAELTGQFVQVGPYAVLSFVSLLSLNLAILNILPFPALDGGRLFFIILEVVFRRKVNQKIEGYAHAIGMAILLSLIALITIHDLIRLFTGQPLLPRNQ